MKAMLLSAEWKPRDTYRFSEHELATKSTYNGNQAFYDPQLRMIDIPVPKAQPGYVLVKVKATGVCGSDVHMYQRDAANYTAYPGHCKFPVVLGHEWSGKVVDVGAGVTNLKVGDLVAVEEMQWCGECTACRSGSLTSAHSLRRSASPSRALSPSTSLSKPSTAGVSMPSPRLMVTRTRLSKPAPWSSRAAWPTTAFSSPPAASCPAATSSSPAAARSG